eukprot:gb/GECG01011602.1/.p1 GENE.gb/GECG01011602.1/~~gb/GECG01011602.1/.p1  ORF type:complete len:243 (+),score=31.01 gb/GECG01011602.1/:1-729(+)
MCIKRLCMEKSLASTMSTSGGEEGTMKTAVQNSKKELRRNIRQTLEKYDASTRATPSSQIKDQITNNLKLLDNVKAVCVFLSMPSKEVDTHDILQTCFAKNIDVYVPQVMDKTTMHMYKLEGSHDFSLMERNHWQVLEFNDATGRREALDADPPLDLVITPGVAFDAQCRRCGQGRGYYDRFFQYLEQRYKGRDVKFPTLVGIGFDEQIVEEVPTGSNDYTLDMVVTPSQVFRREKEDSEGR